MWVKGRQEVGESGQPVGFGVDGARALHEDSASIG